MTRRPRQSYEDTPVPVDRSQGEIRKLIYKHGGTGIAFIEQRPTVGMEFLVPIDGKTYRVRLAANVPDDCGDSAQRERRIWRVLFYHLKSTFEAAASGVLEFRDMILPYIVTNDGRTVAQHLVPKLHAGLIDRPERLLPGAKE